MARQKQSTRGSRSARTTPVVADKPRSHATAPGLTSPAPAPLASPRGTAVYALTIFLSAFLLFQVQLIMGKYVLPWFGGTPAVWNTCMLVYQVLLLGGYAYAFVLANRLDGRGQVRVHLAVLGFSLAVIAVLGFLWKTPLTPGAGWKPESGGHPVWQIVLLLGATIALPFFILSTTGPLVQAWFSRTHAGQSPYRLYALSNLGSLLGLLTYPFLVERWLPLERQAWVWVGAYVAFAAACAAIAWGVARAGRGQAPAAAADHAAAGPAPDPRRRFMWLVLAACASVMLLGTTNLLTQEIAVIPFLWVLPLCLYLLSFVICFDNDRWYRREIFHPLYFLALGGALFVLRGGPQAGVVAQLIACSLALFAVCMVCHGELVRLKPSARHLTSFYLTVAAGGALGGIFVVLIAPLIFAFVWEFQLALVAAGALLIAAVVQDDTSWIHRTPWWAPGLALVGVVIVPQIRSLTPAAWWGPLALGQNYSVAVVGAIVIGVLVLLTPITRTGLHADPRLFAGCLALGVFALGYVAYMQQSTWHRGIYHARNFFGVKSVLQDRRGLWFKHGATLHGFQASAPQYRMEPALYFMRQAGIGFLLGDYPRPAEGGLRVGVVGLGIGTLAAYAREGDYYRFYEIDPQVSALSLGPKPMFTFLRDTRGKWELAMGDARLELERELERGQPQKFDILVMDAFSSDAVPVHLLTREAIELYLEHLRGPDSVLAFNVTNRHVDLAPLLLRIAREYTLHAVLIARPSSQWVLMSANRERIEIPEAARWVRAIPERNLRLWTDSYSNLFDVLRGGSVGAASDSAESSGGSR